ncbi:sulfite exporter TauE/SafE family protein [Cupriavidus necator]|uniref:sulfite exporter TauE/SafE family protein n=1 Tax=Cupriavidus necator TaxID=106590 RepID=UPI002350DC99|nr:sulfite exporter TauE/SafE family protein [Cupriavidus necator]
MTAVDRVRLGVAAAFAGTLNAVAGGGSFLTLPALAMVGVPLVSANATGTAALLPGYMAGAWAQRKDLSGAMAPSLVRLGVLSVLGGAAGAAMLLSTSDTAFGRIVPWLLLGATLLFACGQRCCEEGSLHRRPAAMDRGYQHRRGRGLRRAFQRRSRHLAAGGSRRARVYRHEADEGIKNFVSVILTLMAVVIYAASNAIAWAHARWMTIGATAGAYFGGALARQLKAATVRGFVVLTGLAMTAAFFLKTS